MPVIEYLKDDEHPQTGRKIPKGSQHIVDRDRADQLEKSGKAVVVGSESHRAEQDRTRAINNIQKQTQKSERVAKKAELEETKSSSPSKKKSSTKKKSKSKTKSDDGGK